MRRLGATFAKAKGVTRQAVRCTTLLGVVHALRSISRKSVLNNKSLQKRCVVFSDLSLKRIDEGLFEHSLESWPNSLSTLASEYESDPEHVRIDPLHVGASVATNYPRIFSLIDPGEQPDCPGEPLLLRKAAVLSLPTDVDVDEIGPLQELVESLIVVTLDVARHPT